MIEYGLPVARFVSAAIIGACFVMALIVISGQVAGRPRTSGLLGVTLVLASMVLQAFNVSQASVFGTDTSVYTGGTIVVAVLTAAGLVLLAYAVVRARTASMARR